MQRYGSDSDYSSEEETDGNATAVEEQERGDADNRPPVRSWVRPVASGLAFGTFIAIWQERKAVRGYMQDRFEDLTASRLPPEERARQLRMRHWRHTLSEPERAAWGQAGVLGYSLRDIYPPGYSLLLEDELMSAGQCLVHPEELIWVQCGAEWELLPALFKPRRVARLGVPAAVAALHGLADGSAVNWSFGSQSFRDTVQVLPAGAADSAASADRYLEVPLARIAPNLLAAGYSIRV